MQLTRDKIHELILRAILTLEFEPGQELREKTLADLYHVSRSPVRDSLLRLAQKNLVTVNSRRGYQVKPIRITEVEDTLGLRLIIKPACAAAAARADDAAVRALDRFRDFANSQTGTDLIELNRSFHRAMVELSGNPWRATVALDLEDEFERLLRVSLRAFGQERIPDAWAEHDTIIDALQAHDADRAYRLSYELAATAHSHIATALREIPHPRDMPPTPPG